MKPQLFVSDIEPQEKLFHPVRSVFDLKPEGGLWTSTYLGEDEGSSWVQYCLGSGARNYDEKVNSWLIIPKKEARIYTIDSYSDFEKLVEKYMFMPELVQALGEGIKDAASQLNMDIEHAMSYHTSITTHIDFDKMSQDYDGMHLTQKGMRETKSSSRLSFEGNEIKLIRQKYTLWGYDCECTLWFRWCFEKIKHLGEKDYSNS